MTRSRRSVLISTGTPQGKVYSCEIPLLHRLVDYLSSRMLTKLAALFPL